MNAIAELSDTGFSDDYQLSSMENRLPDNHVDLNKRRYSRMDDKYKIVDEQLRDLARHRRSSAAPPAPVSSLGKVIEQTPLGASQSGHQAPLPEDCALTDFCVAQLPSIKRLVHDAEYDHCVGQSKEVKRAYLKRYHGIKMSNSAWDTNLQGVREMVMVLRKSVMKMLAAAEKKIV
jgi:hypothetical protein